MLLSWMPTGDGSTTLEATKIVIKVMNGTSSTAQAMLHVPKIVLLMVFHNQNGKVLMVLRLQGIAFNLAL
jgi:hypothetical protein